MTEVLTGAEVDRDDLDVTCMIGWNDSTNRLYFMMKIFDDIHQADRSDPEALWTDDSWEIILDADHSGGQFAGFTGLSDKETKRRTGAQATRYLLSGPPFSGAGLVAENAGTWMLELGRFFNVAWGFEGDLLGAGTYFCEGFIVPFDNLSWVGPGHSRGHDLEEGQLIGIGVGVWDFDGSSDEPEGYWTLSGADSGYVYADRLLDLFMSPMDPAIDGGAGPSRPTNRKTRLRRVLGQHGYSAREIWADTYVVPGKPEDVPNLTFTLIHRYSGEMQFGFFDLGKVSVAPGNPGFEREALSNAVVVFRLDEKPGTVFRWEAFAQSEWGLFIIPGGTVKDFLAADSSDLVPLFSIPAANPGREDQMWSFNDLGKDVTIFGFEDVSLAWGVSDKDFNDLMVAVEPAMLGIATLVNPEPSDEMPGSFSLSPNYPNPFNAETTIRYALRDPGRVRLVVYDALGRRVRALVDEEHTAGQYSVLWDGKDDGGEAVSTGVYVCRLDVGEGCRQARRVVLLR